MRFNITINQQRCLEAGLNANQAALMALLTEVSAWATEKVISGKIYWHISRRKVVDEIPLFYEKPDTVYRAFRFLAGKEMIEYVNQNRCDYVRLTPQGKKWNFSEINPSKLGNKSEVGNKSEKLGNKSEFDKNANISNNQGFTLDNSEINPTYNIYNNTNHKRESALDFLKREIPSQYETEIMKFQTGIGADFSRFCEDYNAKVIIELDAGKITWAPASLLARLGTYARSWLHNAHSRKNGSAQQAPAAHPAGNRIELKKRG